MTIQITVTPSEHARIERAAALSQQSVSDFASAWLLAGVEACEDDYIIHEGEVIGDRLAIENELPS